MTLVPRRCSTWRPFRPARCASTTSVTSVFMCFKPSDVGLSSSSSKQSRFPIFPRGTRSSSVRLSERRESLIESARLIFARKNRSSVEGLDQPTRSVDWASSSVSTTTPAPLFLTSSMRRSVSASPVIGDPPGSPSRVTRTTSDSFAGIPAALLIRHLGSSLSVPGGSARLLAVRLDALNP